MKNCNNNLTEEEISKMKKGRFKTLVKKRIRLKSNEFLLKLQENHTKSINLDILEETQIWNQNSLILQKRNSSLD